MNEHSAYFGPEYLSSEGLNISEVQTQKESGLLLEHINNYSGKVVDVCCGHGRHCAELVRQGVANITGIDYSESAIAFARKNISGCQFIVEDILNADYGHNNDLVYSLYNSMAYWDEEDLKVIFRKIKKSLSENGKFIFDFVPTETYLSYEKLYSHKIWSKLIYLISFRKAFKQKNWCRDFISISEDHRQVIFDRSYYQRLRNVKQSQLKITLYDKELLTGILKECGFKTVEFEAHSQFTYVIASNV